MNPAEHQTSSTEARLRAQRKVSLISASIITLLLIVWLVLVLYLIKCLVVSKKVPEIISYSSPTEAETDTVNEVVENEVLDTPPPVSNAVTNVIASQLSAEVSVPTFELNTDELSFELSDPSELLSDWGSSELSNGDLTAGWKGLPKTLSARCSPRERLIRLKKYGGVKQCETAVLKALDWLKQTQNSDGSWGQHHQVGFTGLGLLCFLGHCETPQSELYGDSVQKALTYLISNGVENTGKLAIDLESKQWPYEHAIATYALAEAYTLCRQHDIHLPNLPEIVTQAVQHIVDHQHIISGAWDYSYSTTSQRSGDSSLVCWHLQALKAAKHTQLSNLPDLEHSAKRALDYLGTCQRKSGAVHYFPTHYSSSGPDYPTMTGATLLCYQQWGKGSHSVAKKALFYGKNHMGFRFDSPNADLYKHYYYAQAFINAGGSTWKAYNKQLLRSLLKNQNKNGSWKIPGGGKEIEGLTTNAYTSKSSSAAHYRTCLATLMLEVYYRYLPTK